MKVTFILGPKGTGKVFLCYAIIKKGVQCFAGSYSAIDRIPESVEAVIIDEVEYLTKPLTDLANNKKSSIKNLYIISSSFDKNYIDRCKRLLPKNVTVIEVSSIN